MRYCVAFSCLLVGLVVGLMLGGCSGPSMPHRELEGPEDGLLRRTSPENVLANLRVIYGIKDDLVSTPEDAYYWGGKYAELFHSDSGVFKFYFLPGEAPGGSPQGWWGIEDEVTSFTNLLSAVASGQVVDIRLEWTTRPSEPDSRVDPDSLELLHPDWRLIRVESILLDVDQGQVIYRVSDGLADFYLGPDPRDPALWVVTEWFDLQPYGASVLRLAEEGLDSPPRRCLERSRSARLWKSSHPAAPDWVEAGGGTTKE